MASPRTVASGENEPVTRTRGARRSLPPLVVLAVGVLVTAALAWICWTVNDRNESRLLRVQVQEGGTVLTAAVPSILAPPTSAIAIATATGGDPAKFTAYFSPYVGSGRTYASATLLALTPTPHAVATLGAPPYLAITSARFLSALFRAERSQGPSVIGILGGHADRRIGYAFAGPGSAYAVYVENSLPANARLPVAADAAFSDLDFAVYLGRTPAPAQLLAASNVAALPLSGRTDSALVPVGDSALLVVAKPAGQLGGTLLADLAWIVALAGVALTLTATWIAASLVRGRRLAEQLAVANRALYGHQRGIAETLQRAFLPDELPPIDGLETCLRYRPGVEGIEVGGDWCDVVEVRSGRVLFVVGDVFGRGLDAATTMAALHYASRAYAREGDPPALILAKLSSLVQQEDRRFASVLCGVLDVPAHRLTLANAGHLPPLLVSDSVRQFVDVVPGPPVGVGCGHDYREWTTDVPPQSTLLAFTDGLVERRDEVLDVGLERLRDAVPTPLGSLDDGLDALVAALVLPGARDDTALLGLRWRA